MPNSGCKVCTELMQAAMNAVREQVEVTGLISNAVIAGDERGMAALSQQSSDVHERKDQAISAYRNHLLSHRARVMRAGA